MDWAKTTARWDEKQVLVFGSTYTRGFMVCCIRPCYSMCLVYCIIGTFERHRAMCLITLITILHHKYNVRLQNNGSCVDDLLLKEGWADAITMSILFSTTNWLWYWSCCNVPVKGASCNITVSFGMFMIFITLATVFPINLFVYKNKENTCHIQMLFHCLGIGYNIIHVSICWLKHLVIPQYIWPFECCWISQILTFWC